MFAMIVLFNLWGLSLIKTVFWAKELLARVRILSKVRPGDALCSEFTPDNRERNAFGADQHKVLTFHKALVG
ncbi:MAG TPA: hypothetical protein DCE41_26660 [Cytophagales bacterium]|nr:hypothetical protein [Cytophagales bacterium]